MHGIFDFLKIDPAKQAARRSRRQYNLMNVAFEAKSAGVKGGEFWRTLDPQTQARLVEGSRATISALLSKRNAGTITPAENQYLQQAMAASAPQPTTPPWLIPALIGGGALLVLLITRK